MPWIFKWLPMAEPQVDLSKLPAHVRAKLVELEQELSEGEWIFMFSFHSFICQAWRTMRKTHTHQFHCLSMKECYQALTWFQWFHIIKWWWLYLGVCGVFGLSTGSERMGAVVRGQGDLKKCVRNTLFVLMSLSVDSSV